MLWRHCREKECQIHAFAYLNLFGDGIHNFIDGLVMAAAFLTSIPLGAIYSNYYLEHRFNVKDKV